MIRMQIVGRANADLFRVLKRAIRSKELRTFSLERKGTRVVHIRSPGFMSWTDAEGVVACEIRSPRDEGKEWQLLTNIVGRLADRYPSVVESINIQLTAPPPEPAKKRRSEGNIKALLLIRLTPRAPIGSVPCGVTGLSVDVARVQVESAG